jgi:tetratricopeptide (TPR) repeat protein
MRRINALLFASCLTMVPGGQAQTVIEPSHAQTEEALRQGTEAIGAGRFVDAEKWFQLAVKESPDNADARMELGVAELRLGKPEEASNSLREAITRNPQTPGANLFLGIAYTQMHRVDESLAALDREIELNPTNAQAQMWLGVVELQAGHPEKATGPLDRAAELSPDDLNILEYRGQAHSDVAHDSYARMAAIDPNSWHVHKVQAQLYAMQNLHKEAIGEFLAAIEIVPNNSDLYEELGNEYRKASSLDLAQQAYHKELELSPNNLIAMYNLAKIDIETNQVEEGLGLLRKVVANYANVPATYFYLGLGEFETGKPADAVVALEKARAMHPEADLAPRVEYELSRVYRKLGRVAESDQAVREYTRLKALNAKHNPTLGEGTPTNSAPAIVPATESKRKN